MGRDQQRQAKGFRQLDCPWVRTLSPHEHNGRNVHEVSRSHHRKLRETGQQQHSGLPEEQQITDDITPARARHFPLELGAAGQNVGLQQCHYIADCHLPCSRLSVKSVTSL
jgi:hypothetical protein